MNPALENPNVMHGTVSFNRRVSVRPYESAEAGIYIQFDIPADPSMSDEDRTSQIIANARAAFFQAKALVFEELNLQFQVGPNGVIHEVLSDKFGKVTEVTPQSAAAPAPAAPVAAAPVAAATAPAVTDGPPFSPTTTNRDEKAANKAWALLDIKTNPDDWYYNAPESKRNPKSPDYKHKATGLAVWVS